MQDDDLLHIEAMEIMRAASDELLRISAIGEIDLNTVAHSELRYRLRAEGHRQVLALSQEYDPA